MPKPPATFKAAVRQWVAKDGAVAVAYKTGVSVQAVHGWLHGAEPKGHPLMVVAVHFNVPVETALAWADAARPKKK